MEKAIEKPRESVSKYAPKVKIVMIPVEKIGEVIGPGGKIIKGIIADTGAQVDVDDDGSVSITATDVKAMEAAVETVENLVKEVKPGEFYDGKVTRIQPFGAHVEVLPGKEGLVHVSDMAEGFVKDPGDLVKVGDQIKVRVKEIDNFGRINLSMLLDGDKKKDTRSGNRGGGGRGFNRSSSRGRQFSGNRGGGRSFDRGGGRGKSSGPHFPTTRLLDDKKDFNR